jgi:hypothetical protein
VRRGVGAGLAILMASVLTAGPRAQGGRGGEPPDRPAPRTDANSRIAHEQLLEKAGLGRIDLYFAGDSITRRWGATDYPELLAHIRETFHGWNAANFAWGGDQTQHILWRLENGELEGVNPKVVVVLAGTNNVGRTVPPGGDDEKAAGIARGIAAIVEAVQERAPDATTVLMAVFPRNDNMAVLSTIGKINERIEMLADGTRVRGISGKDWSLSGTHRNGGVEGGDWTGSRRLRDPATCRGRGDGDDGGRRTEEGRRGGNKSTRDGTGTP